MRCGRLNSISIISVFIFIIFSNVLVPGFVISASSFLIVKLSYSSASNSNSGSLMLPVVDRMGFGTVRGHLGCGNQCHTSPRRPGRALGPLRITKSVGGCSIALT